MTEDKQIPHPTVSIEGKDDLKRLIPRNRFPEGMREGCTAVSYEQLKQLTEALTAYPYENSTAYAELRAFAITEDIKLNTVLADIIARFPNWKTDESLWGKTPDTQKTDTRELFIGALEKHIATQADAQKNTLKVAR